MRMLMGLRALILETSSIASCLVFAEGRQLLAHVPLVGGPTLSATLPQAVAQLLDQDRPHLIAVSTGPGSTTGVRVGLALARTLAFGWEIPCIEFSSLLGYIPATQTQSTALLIHAHRAGVYLHHNRKPLSTQPVALTELPPLLQEVDLLISPHPEEIPFHGRTILPACPDPAALIHFAIP